MNLKQSCEMFDWSMQNHMYSCAKYAAKEIVRNIFSISKYKLRRVLVFFNVATYILMLSAVFAIIVYALSPNEKIDFTNNVKTPSNWEEFVVLKDSSVNMKNLDKEILIALPIIHNLYHKYGSAEVDFKPTVTSANDFSGHKPSSLHYKGKAIDFSVRSINQRFRGFLVKSLAAELGRRYLVLHEDIGKPNEHIHIQLKRLDHFIVKEFQNDKSE